MAAAVAEILVNLEEYCMETLVLDCKVNLDHVESMETKDLSGNL